jgi:DNA mismatch repair protein MutS2
MGFLDQLRETGATVAVTTHFDGLKTYGYLHSDVQNVAVEFDEKTLEPKYQLAYGSSGLSNAFLIAEKLGISAKIIERAKHYHDGSGQEVARSLESLEKLKAQTRKEREGLLESEADVRREREKLKDLLDSIKKKRQEIFARAEEKARKAAQKVEEELKEWLRQQREERKNLRLATLHRKEIQQIKERFFPAPRIKKGDLKAPERLRVGDRVRIGPLRNEGVLMKVEESLGRVEVSTDKGIVKVPFSHIVKIRDDEEAKEMNPGLSVSSPKEFQETPSEINVIGLTVDDAIPVVDKFIDRALLHGLEKICIIHGVGSGRLRSGIGEYLKGHRGVKSFGPGDPMKGGGGITIVELT